MKWLSIRKGRQLLHRHQADLKQTKLFLERFFNFLIKLSVLIGAVLLIINQAATAYHKTIGKRQFYYDKLASLNAGAQLGYFQSVLGDAKYLTKIDTLRDYTFVNPYFYVDAKVDDSGSVLLYSVTTRQSDFTPSLKVWGLSNSYQTITLNKTHFSDLGKIMGAQSGVNAEVGVHHSYYSEIFWGANPGNYQYFAFTDSEAGSFKMGDASPYTIFTNNGGDVKLGFYQSVDISQVDKWAAQDLQVKNFLKIPRVANYRNHRTINTYSVSAPGFSLFTQYPDLHLGPDYNEIRVDVSSPS